MQGSDPNPLGSSGSGPEPIPIVLRDQSGCERSVWVTSIFQVVARAAWPWQMRCSFLLPRVGTGCRREPMDHPSAQTRTETEPDSERVVWDLSSHVFTECLGESADLSDLARAPRAARPRPETPTPARVRREPGPQGSGMATRTCTDLPLGPNRGLTTGDVPNSSSEPGSSFQVVTTEPFGRKEESPGHEQVMADSWGT